jgi:hypothetical protein
MFSQIPNYNEYYTELLQETNNRVFSSRLEREEYFLNQIRKTVKGSHADKKKMLLQVVDNKYLVDIMIEYYTEDIEEQKKEKAELKESYYYYNDYFTRKEKRKCINLRKNHNK